MLIHRYATASKASTAGDYRAQKQPPNQNYESRSMIIDRSSSLTSSGRFHPEPLLKLQQVANGEPPLPVIQFMQEQASQRQGDSAPGNSQIPKDVLRNFATNGFRKLTGPR